MPYVIKKQHRSPTIFVALPCSFKNGQINPRILKYFSISRAKQTNKFQING